MTTPTMSAEALSTLRRALKRLIRVDSMQAVAKGRLRMPTEASTDALARVAIGASKPAGQGWSGCVPALLP